MHTTYTFSAAAGEYMHLAVVSRLTQLPHGFLRSHFNLRRLHWKAGMSQRHKRE